MQLNRILYFSEFFTSAGHTVFIIIRVNELFILTVLRGFGGGDVKQLQPSAGLCGLTLSSLLQDAEDRVVGSGSVDVLQDLVHTGGLRTAGQNHPLLTFRTNIHCAADPDPPRVICTQTTF